jgi:hypothetical protein
MSTFSIHDHGLLIKRWSPAYALDDIASRRRSVIHALELIRTVVRPLALEITLGPMDAETFAVTPVESRRVASRGIPAGVACQTALSPAGTLEVVDSLTADAVARALTPEQTNWDFATVSALTTAAYTSANTLQVEQMPSVTSPIIEMDGVRWAVGPIDLPGARLIPPIGIRWHQEWGDLQLAIEALWSPWWQTSSAEYAALRAAEKALDDAGFRVNV